MSIATIQLTTSGHSAAEVNHSHPQHGPATKGCGLVSALASFVTAAGRSVCTFAMLLPIGVLASSTLAAKAQEATTITLGAYPSNTVAVGTSVELLALVQSGGSSVPYGVVNFCDAAKAGCSGSALLGQAELTNSPVAGTAAIFLRLGIGTHKVKAVFLPQNALAGSTTATQTVTVTGARYTNNGITASGSAGNYTLTSKVSTSGRKPAVGSVSFLDSSDSNFSLGSAALIAGKTSSFFGNLPLEYVGLAPVSMAVADFNSDGIPDIAVLNELSDSVQILYGDGLGGSSYSYQVTVPSPFGLTVGDFNGDGIPDLAVTDDTNNQVHILLVAADKSFSEYSAQAAGHSPGSIAVGDFDGNGTLDLLVADSAGISLLTGTGSGSFNPPTYFSVGNQPGTLAVADFNGDGKPDFAVGSNGSGLIRFYIGHGDSTFTGSQALYGGSSPYSIATGDFNADGLPDLVSVSSTDNLFTSFAGNGDGTFTQKYTFTTGPYSHNAALTAADFDGDGHEDVAFVTSADGIVEPGSGTPSTLGILRGLGDGTFANASAGLATGGNPLGIVSSDWDGDGFVDLAFSNSADGSIQLVKSHVSTTATATLSGVSVPGGGSHSIYANYAGSAAAKASKSGSIALTGSPIQTTTALAVAPGFTVTKGQTVQLTATVAASKASNLTDSGSVKFYDGATVLATVTLTSGKAAYSTSTLAVGSHSLKTVYSGDTNFVTSTSPVSTLTVKAPAAATPTFTPAPGTYTGTQTVTIKSATSGAVIYYTTNGSTPTTSSAKYTAPIKVSVSETVEAIATATNFSASAVATGVYTIH